MRIVFQWYSYLKAECRLNRAARSYPQAGTGVLGVENALLEDEA